jgi:hypothetical protein
VRRQFGHRGRVFSTNSFETFLIFRRSERDMVKNVYWSSCKVPLILVSMKLEFSRQILDKCSNFKFCENPPNASPVVPCGWTDRHDEISRLFSCVRCGWCRASRTAPSAPYTRPTRRLSRPPPIQKLGAENHMLQLNI